MPKVTRQDCLLHRTFYSANPTIVHMIDIVLKIMDERHVDVLDVETPHR